jgi:hypothetical protein
MVEPWVIAQALQGTALEGRAVRARPVRDTGEVGFEVPNDDLEPLTAWRIARDACAGIEVWPLVGCAGPNTYGRRAISTPEDQSPQAILRRAEHLSWPQSMPPAPVPHDVDEWWPRVVRGSVIETMRRLGDAPDAAELLERFSGPDYAGLEAWLLSWEERQRPTLVQEPAGRFDTVWEADVFEPGIALLPTSLPWALPAYVDYWGAGYAYGPEIGHIGYELLTVAMRDWYDRFGAVPWAATGVTVHFTVERPPGNIADAFQLATELARFCKWDESYRQLARGLLHSEFWELYDRP